MSDTPNEPNQATSVIIGKSEHAERMRQFVARAGNTSDTLFIRGPTGAGKDHLAQAIHDYGRRTHQIVMADCGAIPETLFEDEFLGHEKGAFTDARERRIGHVENTRFGTLVINEVANMTYSMQAKFLRILDGRTFRRIGGKEEIPIETRFIVATNADLEGMIREGEFRQDLWFRLNVVVFRLPALREHSEDVPDLAKHFLAIMGKGTRSFTDGALQALQSYHWPGNVRQLITIVQRLVFWHDGEIDAPQVFHSLVDEGEVGDNAQVELQAGQFSLNIGVGGFPGYEEIELEFFRQAARRTGGNVQAAAKLAHVGRQTFINKINGNPGFKELVESLRGKVKS